MTVIVRAHEATDEVTKLGICGAARVSVRAIRAELQLE